MFRIRTIIQMIDSERLGRRRFESIESLKSLEHFESESLEIVDMQIDDTLILVNSIFAIEKKKTIKKTKILTKTRDHLITKNSIKFNETKIALNSSENITIVQKSHVSDIFLIINHETSLISFRDIIRVELSSKKQYVTQRAQNVYIVSICQLETFFDLFHTAQSIDFFSDEIISLNKRLQWQLNNKIRDLRYVKLDQIFLQLVIFTNSLFINN
jgi:hypothetical protein